jgi:aminoglycoside phosphotransferase (APT) family kinase protein
MTEFAHFSANHLEPALRDWFGSDVEFSLHLSGSTRYRWSKHWRIRVDTTAPAPRDILVKWLLDRDESGREQPPETRAPDRACVEFDALKRIHRIVAATGSGNLSAVEPIACFPEHHALAMTYVPGKHVLHLLQRAGILGRRPTPELRSAGWGAGELLAKIHQEALPSDPEPTQITRENQGRVLASLHAGVRSLVPQAIDMGPVNAVVQKRIDAVSKQALIFNSTQLHGDYYPENIILSAEKKIFTIDTTLLARGAAEFDVAKFVAGAFFTKRWLLFGGAGMSAAARSGLVDDFLAGYQSVRKITPAVFQYYYLAAILQRWIEVMQVLSNQASGLLFNQVCRALIIPKFRSALEQNLQFSV